MYLMQTVSTTPRARPLQATEDGNSMERSGEIPTLQHVRTSGGEDWSDGARSPLSPGPGFVYPSVIRSREKDPTEKKKKWSLGGLFRRRKKDVGSESSSQDEEEEAPRKGFLARRRSRREKRKTRTNRAVGTFDHVVVNPLTQTLKPPIRSEAVTTVNEVSDSAKDANGNTVVKSKDVQLQIEDVRRSRSRESRQGGSIDRLSPRSSRESFQRHSRQDSSLSRNSSGGSGSIEQGSGSRRGRRGAMKARVEALRDRQRADSSSEEGDASTSSPLSRFKSDDTLSVSLQSEGSLNRRSRVARTERYIKRLSRDEEGVLKREAAEIEFQRQQRLCKSDAEGSFNRPSLTRNKGIPSNNRWVVTNVQQESSDVEHHKLFLRGSSATPSPGHSPLVRHKTVAHYTNSAPPCPSVYDAAASTFPPGHTIHYATPVTTNSLDRKTPQHGLRPRGPSPLLPSNISIESIPAVGIPRARISDYRQNKLNFEHGPSTRNDREYIEFQQPGQRSLSYDSNIHRVMPAHGGPSPVPDGDVMVVQFPVARLPPSFQQSRNLDSRNSSVGSGFVAVKQCPPPPPPRDPQRRLICTSLGHQDIIRPMSYVCDSIRFQQPLDYQLQTDLSKTGVSPFTIPQLRHHGSVDTTVADNPWSSYNQRRSNSDNQLATHNLSHQSQAVRHHVYNPINRPRPSSVTPESMKSMSNQIQYNGSTSKYIIRTTPSPDTYSSSSKQSLNTNQQQQFQYFADQQPRSRRPIRIQYNTNTASSDQPYLSDSQVVLMKPPHQNQEKRNPMQHATEFWRQKDQEGAVKMRKTTPTSPRLLVRHTTNERSRSNSPRPKELPTGLVSNSDSMFRIAKTSKVRIPPLTIPAVRAADSLSSLSGNSDISSPLHLSSSNKFSPDISMHDTLDSQGSMDSLKKKENSGNYRPLSMVLEKTETPDQAQQSENVQQPEVPLSDKPSCREEQPIQPEKQPSGSVKTVPPIPPTRRYSRQSSASSLEAADWMSEDVGTTSEEGRKKKRKSSNLEDALTELEAIYKSLKLGDEDLLDRAERRDLPTPHQKLNSSISETIQPQSSSWGTSRGAESDSGYNYSWGSSSFESLFDSGEPHPRRRAPSIRRSGIPDKVMDDMAYRRLHPKERPGSQDIRNVVSQSGSYLLASPAAAAAEISPEELPQKPLYASASQEPDVTLDDVVFRNIRHANSTLKVLDPQPPFGIPLGPITPAPNSDYLHAVPTDSYRPMFKPRKNPDVVKDDLAYRNLRKDSSKDHSFCVPLVTDDMAGILNISSNPSTHSKNENFSMRKRRAVRSLSANIQTLVNRDCFSFASRDIDQDFEKAQSLSDLPDALQVAQKILEGKEIIGGGSIKIRNLTKMLPNQQSSDQEGDLLPHSQESRRYCPSPGRSWVERATLADCGDRSSLFATTSTETLTDSRANLLQQDFGSNKRNSWQQKLRVFIPSNKADDSIESIDISNDTAALQRPSPSPVTERNLSRVQIEQNKATEIQFKPPPPPTPERSSSRRPSLDQNKLLSSLGQLASSLTPDRSSTLQLEQNKVQVPKESPVSKSGRIPGDEISTEGSLSEKYSDRQSLEQISGKLSPQVDEILPIPKSVPGSPLDEKQLEELLTALAREAKATSQKLERELEELDEGTKSSKVKYNSQSKTNKEVVSNKNTQENAAELQLSVQENKQSEERVNCKSEKIEEQDREHKESYQLDELSQGPGLISKSVDSGKQDNVSDDIVNSKSKQFHNFSPENLANHGGSVTLIKPLPQEESDETQMSNRHAEVCFEVEKKQKTDIKSESVDESKNIAVNFLENGSEKLKEVPINFAESVNIVQEVGIKSANKSPEIESEVTSIESHKVKKADAESQSDEQFDIPVVNESPSMTTLLSCENSLLCVEKRNTEPLDCKTVNTDELSKCKISRPEPTLNSVDNSDTQTEECSNSAVKDIDSSAVPQEPECCREGEDVGASASPSAAAGWYCLPPLVDPASVLVACSYCIACAHQIVGLDFLTVLGIILAIVSLVAALIL